MAWQRLSRREEERAHDVLAAEAFAVPAPDPGLRPRRVVLPEDPSGILEPHDILAAEEFAMPAVTLRPGDAIVRATGLPSWSMLGAAAGTALAWLGLRHRRV